MIKCYAKTQIACRGDRRMCTQMFGDLDCKCIGSFVSAKQWHHRGSILSYGDYSRLGKLVLDKRCQKAHQGACGHKGNDRLPIPEEPANMLTRILKI